MNGKRSECAAGRRGLAAGLLALLAMAGSAAAEPIEARLQALAEGEHRAPGHAERNDWRHPASTLAWFGIREDMTVVEIWPGGSGWYTEILAPFLRERGRLYAANYAADAELEYFRVNARKFRDKLAAQPRIYDRVVITELHPPHALEAAPPGSADRVLTFRNLHNWIRRDIAGQMFAAIYEALKPGGMLGLVAHRAAPGTEALDPKAEKGYVTEAHAIALAEAAGFELIDRSEINANPRDTRDHPEGVWNLPPSFRGAEADRERYAAIGESDRMTLKFAKPVQ